VVVAGYANSRAKIDAQKDAAHIAQFHIGIRQYYTGSTKRNHLFINMLRWFAIATTTQLPRAGP